MVNRLARCFLLDSAVAGGQPSSFTIAVSMPIQAIESCLLLKCSSGHNASLSHPAEESSAKK